MKVINYAFNPSMPFTGKVEVKDEATDFEIENAVVEAILDSIGYNFWPEPTE